MNEYLLRSGRAAGDRTTEYNIARTSRESSFFPSLKTVPFTPPGGGAGESSDHVLPLWTEPWAEIFLKRTLATSRRTRRMREENRGAFVHKTNR